MSLFEAWLLFGHVLLFVLLGRVYICGAGFPFAHVLLSDGLLMFLSLKPCRCLVTFRSLDRLFMFFSLELGRPMGPEAQNTTLSSNYSAEPSRKLHGMLQSSSEALTRLDYWELHGWSHLDHDSLLGQLSLVMLLSL